MSVPTNLIPTKITGLPEYTGSSQAGYFPYVLDGSTYKVQFSNVASAGEVPPSRTLTAGTGLVGGGDLSANRVFAIANGGVGASQLDTTGVVAGVYGNGSNVPTVTVDANGRVTSVTTSPVVATGYVPEGRTVTAGTGLLGGGSLANNITLSLNLATATPQALGTATAGVSTAAAREDHVHPAVDLSDTNETQGSLPLGRGGTGDALSPVAGAVVYSTGTKLALTNPGIPGQVLTSTGTDEPLWTTLTGTGTVTSVNASGGTTGMTFTGGPVTTIGTLTLGGTLGTDNGGTGVTGTPTNGQLLIGNGAGYTLAALTAGTGVSVGNAAGAITITNTAPDRIVSLTGAGTTSISGTYPNFTITSNDQFVGTVTSVAASGGTTGLTFSGSPITSAGTLTLGGTLAIGSGGTGASTAGAARTALGAAALGANTDITSIALTSGTILNAPTSGTDIVNKAYADSIASGINFHQSVRLATVAALPAYTYNNGSSGVGATITANANGALSIDGVAVVAGNRVLIKNEVGAAQANQGVYVVTQTGNGSTPFILTRATDFDSAGTGVDQIDAGDFFLVTAGSTQANTSWVQQTPLPITVGTTPIIFSQFAAPVLYSAGTGLSLAGTVFSITNTGVTASTYGSASQVPVLAVNAQGQITSANSTTIAISASQITSGVLPVANGGTGATTFTSTGLLVGNGTSAVTTTAAGATGQVLVGNTGAAPTWATLSSTAVTSFSAGTTGLTPSLATTGAITLDGVLKVSNGGTGVTTATGSGSAVLSNSPTLVTPTLGAASATSIAAGLGAVGTPSYTFTGDLNTGMWSPAADTIAFSEGGVEAMRIDSNANVGIGTSAPTQRLDILDQNNAGFRLTQYSDVDGAVLRLFAGRGTIAAPAAVTTDSTVFGIRGIGYTSAGAFGIASATINGRAAENFTATAQGTYLQFSTTAIGTATVVERMRIASDGNVGIGITNPGYPLTVQASSGSGAVRLVGRSADSVSTLEFINNTQATTQGFIQSNGNNLLFATSTSERMRITALGNVGIGTSAPQGLLHVVAGTDNTLLFRGPINYATGGSIYAVNSANSVVTPMEFGASSYFFAGGNVGIGTSAPTGRLGVAVSGSRTIGTAWGTSSVLIGSPGPFSGNFGMSFDTTNGATLESAAPGVATYPIRIVGSINQFFTTNVERMRIDSSGRVGINTSAPQQIFQVATSGQSIDGPFFSSSTGPWMRFIPNSSPGAYNNIVAAGTNSFIFSSGSVNAGTLTIAPWADGTSGVVINASGNVGIGTNAPNTRLNVVSTGSNTLQVDTSGLASNAIFNKDNTAGGFFIFNFSGTGVGSITTNGTTTSYNTFSDARLKDNIADADDAASLIDTLQVRKFDWKSNGSHQRYGLVAQELFEVAPEAVHAPEDEDQMMAVDYSKLVPMLIKEVQSLRARVAQLEGN